MLPVGVPDYRPVPMGLAFRTAEVCGHRFRQGLDRSVWELTKIFLGLLAGNGVVVALRTDIKNTSCPR